MAGSHARIRKGTKAVPWSEATRKKIQTSMILNRLIDHTLGKIEMEDSQVRAGLGLMKKVLPDLSATELSGEVGLRHEDALKALK